LHLDFVNYLDGRGPSSRIQVLDAMRERESRCLSEIALINDIHRFTVIIQQIRPALVLITRRSPHSRKKIDTHRLACARVLHTHILGSKELGFSQKEVRRLTNLARQQQPTCADVHELPEDHINDIRKRIRELTRMEQALVRLKVRCKDGTLHDCPVIDRLME
jgi:MerR family mercuric resistance operon transcriptional regulator